MTRKDLTDVGIKALTAEYMATRKEAWILKEIQIDWTGYHLLQRFEVHYFYAG